MNDDNPQLPNLTRFLQSLGKEQLIGMLMDICITFDDKGEEYTDNQPSLVLCNSDAYNIRYYLADLEHGKVDGKTND